jgi:hypothetical protein
MDKVTMTIKVKDDGKLEITATAVSLEYLIEYMQQLKIMLSKK